MTDIANEDLIADHPIYVKPYSDLSHLEINTLCQDITEYYGLVDPHFRRPCAHFSAKAHIMVYTSVSDHSHTIVTDALPIIELFLLREAPNKFYTIQRIEDRVIIVFDLSSSKQWDLLPLTLCCKSIMGTYVTRLGHHQISAVTQRVSTPPLPS